MKTTRNAASLTSLSLLALTLSLGAFGCAAAPQYSTARAGYSGDLRAVPGGGGFVEEGFEEEYDEGYGDEGVYVDGPAISASVSIGGVVATHVGLVPQPTIVVSPVFPMVPPVYSPAGVLIAGGDIGDHYGDEIEIEQNVRNVTKIKNVHNRSRTRINNSTRISSRRGAARKAGRRNSAQKSRVVRKSTRRSGRSKHVASRKASNWTRRPAVAQSRNTRRAAAKRTSSRSGRKAQNSRKHGRNKNSRKHGRKHN